jgi:hypothetical protein
MHVCVDLLRDTVDICMSYEMEDTCMSYEEEDTCMCASTCSVILLIRALCQFFFASFFFLPVCDVIIETLQ